MLARNSCLGFSWATSDEHDREELGQEEVREEALLQALLGARGTLGARWSLAARSSGNVPVLAASICTVFMVMAGLRPIKVRRLDEGWCPQ
mmetsp:Transcript_52630/g.156962  ORF Transcript_52630/g.156962 Transcript_52630/m.156962 type:complete len:91 (+) Transcript_52630:64-336(+)